MMIQLERDPHAGDPLLGGLIGYRKVAVGDRDWRVVWRVVRDDTGDYLIEVAEVWAVGYRKDSEVYGEISRRVSNAGPSPQTKALSEVLELFAEQARNLTATSEPDKPEPVPKWLSDALLHVVHLPASHVENLGLEEAEKEWADHISGAGRPASLMPHEHVVTNRSALRGVSVVSAAIEFT